MKGFAGRDNSQPGLALHVRRTICCYLHFMRFARPSSVLLSLIAAACLQAAQPVAANLTLEQALDSVERVNLNVLLSRETTAQVLEQTRLSRSNILPIIDASAAQRRSRGVSITNGRATQGSTSSRFDANLTGSYSLLDLERISALRSSKLNLEVARANYQAVVQDVLFDVGFAYFRHLRNLKRLAVLDANITRARSLHELARNQLNAGVATQIDVTRAEAQLAQAEQARLQQVTTLYESELFLKRLLDTPPGQPVQLADFAVRRADANLSVFSEDRSTFEKRADYLAAQRALEVSKNDVKTATFQRLPALTLTGQYSLAAEKFTDDPEAGWSAGIGLSVPVFDGFRAGSDKRIALSRQRAQEFRLHNLEMQISSELHLAQQDANSRNAQVTVAETGLRLAQEELRLAQQRYQNGVADNREVVEAQTRLALADDNFVEAVYQYNLSRVELARARGDVRTVLSEKVP